MSILQVEKLVKTFGRRRVVDGVSLNVHRGEIVGLLGPNGAGKTTTFRMICGQLKPDNGTVMLAGKDVTDWPMFQRARHGGMGYLPQQSSIFGKLTVQQNLIAMMQLLKMDRKTRNRRCSELLEQFNIEKLRKARAGKLSGGERRRLEIARCLVSNPEIIMLDEPFAGIDPVTVQSIQQVIQNLKNDGLAILITDHAAREILQITDRTYVVSEGSILCSGSAEEIVQNDEVKRKYLGDIDFVQQAPSVKTQKFQQAPEPAEAGQETMEYEVTGQTENATSAPDDSPVFEESVEYDEPTIPFRPDESDPPTKKRKRSRIRRPDITKTSAFDDIEAPFSSRDIE